MIAIGPMILAIGGPFTMVSGLIGEQENGEACAVLAEAIAIR
ncbi:MAG: hypothetical protein R3B96_02840 [Pirellulaceae bacterium]